MVPLIEQRGAIPIGIIAYSINPFIVFITCLLGSLVPAPIIYLSFNKIFEWMKSVKKFNRITNIIDKKVQKGSTKLEKYKEIGLIAFVGIPLPTTGIWTGSAVAAFLGLNFKKSMLYVFIGGVISATIITALSTLFPFIFSS